MHREYKRIVDDASAGILLIHGITSTPNHFRDLIDLIPQDLSIHALLLDGHGKNVKDFSKTSMKKWEAQVAQAVEDMARSHQKIYILAHSLGTLLSIEQAVKNPKITGMFLLASPLRIFVKPCMVPMALRFSRGTVPSDDPVAEGFAQSYSIQPDKNVFHYVGWIPRFLELFRKSRKTRKLISQIPCPTTVFQSQKDELVSMRSCKDLKNNPNITLGVLPLSGHCYYSPEDLVILRDSFSQFLS